MRANDVVEVSSTSGLVKVVVTHICPQHTGVGPSEKPRNDYVVDRSSWWFLMVAVFE